MTEARESTRLCPRCGEENPPAFPVCWSCRSDLPPEEPRELEREREREPEPVVAPASEPDPAARAARRKRLVLEVAVVLGILWLPSLVGGILHAIEPFPPLDVLGAVLAMLTSSAYLALLGYLAWLDGGVRRLLGVRKPLGADVLWAAGTFVVVVVASEATRRLATLFGLPSSPPAPHFLPDAGWIAPVYFLFGAAFEEALFRGYLWGRFRALTGHPWLSVLAASVLFSAYHVYPPADSLAVLVFGLVLGAVFLARRSLWPVVLAHWAWNVFVATGS